MDRQDYEPGPAGASYSRTGPPPSVPAVAAPAAAERLKQEIAQELAPQPQGHSSRSASRIGPQ